MKNIITLLIIGIVAVCSLSFLGVERFTQQVDFDVATGGASKTFDGVQSFGEHITVQVFYSGLDADDGTITFLQSTDNIVYDSISTAFITLQQNVQTHTINIVRLRTAFVRAVWTKGSNTVGTIEKLNYNFRTEH